MYLVDAAIELGWIIAWGQVYDPAQGDRQQFIWPSASPCRTMLPHGVCPAWDTWQSF
jgi:hypothetical protein